MSPAEAAGKRAAAEIRPPCQGLDPNVWMGSVELLAAREIGQETVRYVSNIFKYSLVYKRMMEEKAPR